MRRIESLDCLRGLMALSVALYHFVGMSYDWPPTDHILAKLGIYAVSVFFVLSGLSLTHVYKERLDSGRLVAAYTVKRIFRIAPLDWLAVTLAVVVELITGSRSGTTATEDYLRLFLNYSLLFGFVKPDAYVPMGGWSIGNEMVFYALFPLLVYLGLKGKARLAAVGLGFFVLYVVFAFVLLDDGKLLERQFTTYLNPFNQAFLFVAGVMIGFLFEPGLGRMAARWLLPLFAAAFYFFPVAGNYIVLVTGAERIVLSLLCIALVAAVYVSDFALDNHFGRALRLLGEMSYSVYLLHPFVAIAIMLVASKAGSRPGETLLTAMLAIGIPATLLVSYVSFRWLERPTMRWGRRVAARISADGREPAHPPMQEPILSPTPRSGDGA